MSTLGVGELAWGAGRVSVSLSVHFLLHLLAVLIVGITPIQGIDDFAASLTSVLIAAIVVDGTYSGL